MRITNTIFVEITNVIGSYDNSIYGGKNSSGWYLRCNATGLYLGLAIIITDFEIGNNL